MMNYLYIYLILLTYYIIWYIIAQIKNNDSLVDVAWGLGIVVSAISSILLSSNYTLSSILITGLTTIWGLRLTGYLFKRNFNKSEDYRYQNMKTKWKTNIRIKSFFKVYMLQAILNYLVALPIILTNLLQHEPQDNISLLLITIGTFLFAIGFTFEVLADHSLAHFKKEPQNKGKVMQKNVWKYSRHPNYFGEVTLWWGIGMISLSTMRMVSFLGLIGPLIMTISLLYITGIPLLENRYKDNLEYQAYAQKTSRFFPMIPKK